MQRYINKRTVSNGYHFRMGKIVHIWEVESTTFEDDFSEKNSLSLNSKYFSMLSGCNTTSRISPKMSDCLAERNCRRSRSSMAIKVTISSILLCSGWHTSLKST